MNQSDNYHHSAMRCIFPLLYYRRTGIIQHMWVYPAGQLFLHLEISTCSLTHCSTSCLVPLWLHFQVASSFISIYTTVNTVQSETGQRFLPQMPPISCPGCLFTSLNRTNHTNGCCWTVNTFFHPFIPPVWQRGWPECATEHKNILNAIH